MPLKISRVLDMRGEAFRRRAAASRHATMSLRPSRLLRRLHGVIFAHDDDFRFGRWSHFIDEARLAPREAPPSRELFMPGAARRIFRCALTTSLRAPPSAPGFLEEPAYALTRQMRARHLQARNFQFLFLLPARYMAEMPIAGARGARWARAQIASIWSAPPAQFIAILVLI